MTIFLVYDSDRCIAGVFSTKELAEIYVGCNNLDYYEIEEHDLGGDNYG